MLKLLYSEIVYDNMTIKKRKIKTVYRFDWISEVAFLSVSLQSRHDCGLTEKSNHIRC